MSATKRDDGINPEDEPPAVPAEVDSTASPHIKTEVEDIDPNQDPTRPTVHEPAKEGSSAPGADVSKLDPRDIDPNQDPPRPC